MAEYQIWHEALVFGFHTSHVSRLPMQNRLLISPQIMMRLRRWLALGLVDNFLHPRDLTVVGIGQKTNIVIGIRRQHLSDRAELRGKIRMG